jgi:hypothetical protein
MNRIFTKGDVEVQGIKIGDIHYEYEYGCCIKTKVLTVPQRNEYGQWEWKSERLSNGEVINYAVHEEYLHYAPNLYNYEAYSGCKMI